MMTALKHITAEGESTRSFEQGMCLGVIVGTHDCQFGMHC